MPAGEQQNIVVDFEVDSEHVHLTIRNMGNSAALNLQIRPSAPIIGSGGNQDLSRLAIFKEISYFAPNKLIRIFVDEFESFFRNLKNTKISFAITWQDENGKPVKHSIHHDLVIYKDLSYLIHKK